MAKFVVYFNGEPLKTYEFDEPVISIGRLPENTISIPNMGVSRRHAKIEEDADRKYILADLNSLNGTYVNGKRVKKIPINSGDKITIGKYTIIYEESRAVEKGTGFNHLLTPSQPVVNPKMEPALSSPVPSTKTDVHLRKNLQPESYAGDSPKQQHTTSVDNAHDKDDKEPQNMPVFIETNKHVVYKIDKSFLSIGSGDEDDIFISGFMIGPGQITLEKRDDGIYIIANKLMGKIKVNGKACRSHLLQHKDRIEIGSSTFRFMENG
ncbi:MAG TPA: FHA domain-containing protein [Chitinispirillaceae bacterium]|nr:FHA domain-containing protein [Chitinispirillaceae bacterium]